jgi:hypothetical protein
LAVTIDDDAEAPAKTWDETIPVRTVSDQVGVFADPAIAV